MQPLNGRVQELQQPREQHHQTVGNPKSFVLGGTVRGLHQIHGHTACGSTAAELADVAQLDNALQPENHPSLPASGCVVRDCPWKGSVCARMRKHGPHKRRTLPTAAPKLTSLDGALTGSSAASAPLIRRSMSLVTLSAPKHHQGRSAPRSRRDRENRQRGPVHQILARITSQL